MEALQQALAVVVHRVRVGGQTGLGLLAQRLRVLLGGELAQGHEQGRLAPDAEALADRLGQLGEGLQAVLGGPLLLGLLEALLVGLLGQHRPDLLEGQVRVPELEGAGLGEARHRLAVSGHRAHGRGLDLLLLEAALAAGHDDARREALQVPLPGAGQGLVEVVDVEDLGARGRGVGAEVREVGVAAELHRQAARRAAAPGRRP